MLSRENETNEFVSTLGRHQYSDASGVTNTIKVLIESIAYLLICLLFLCDRMWHSELIEMTTSSRCWVFVESIANRKMNESPKTSNEIQKWIREFPPTSRQSPTVQFDNHWRRWRICHELEWYNRKWEIGIKNWTHFIHRWHSPSSFWWRAAMHISADVSEWWFHTGLSRASKVGISRKLASMFGATEMIVKIHFFICTFIDWEIE